MADKYKRLLRLTLSENELRRDDFPRPDPNCEGKVKLYGEHFGFTEGHCKRCHKMFDTTYRTRQPCDFHLENSKYFNRRHHPHGCCGGAYGSRGCREAPSHVYKGNLYLDLTGYRPTESRLPVDGHHGVYAMDTESVHTVRGLEVSRATVVDMDLKVVYDHLCIPDSEIIDYNTIWSGVTKNDFEGVTKTYEELREDLFKLFSKETIVIGHGLSSDFIGLKMIHDTVIDTTDLYPHERGPPRKKSLKELSETYLRRQIQTGEGHSSEEDAKATMELVLRKL